MSPTRCIELHEDAAAAAGKQKDYSQCGKRKWQRAGGGRGGGQGREGKRVTGGREDLQSFLEGAHSDDHTNRVLQGLTTMKIPSQTSPKVCPISSDHGVQRLHANAVTS